MTDEITLDSLVGLHSLTGVEMTQTKVQKYDGEWEDVDSITFRLDGKTYTAVEDPSDGYRSCMKNIILEKKQRIANKFQAVKVMAIKKRGNYHEHETLEFIDVINGKTILEVGTDNFDDYYPTFVARFIPQNMEINKNVEKQQPT